MTTDTSKPTSRQEHAENLVVRYSCAIDGLSDALESVLESLESAKIGSTYSNAALQSLDDSDNVVLAQDAGISDEVSEAAVVAAHATRLAVAAIVATARAISEAYDANYEAFYASVASVIATKPPAEAVVLTDAVYTVRRAEKTPSTR